MDELIDLDSQLSYIVVSNCGGFGVLRLSVVGGQERPFYLILEAESVHCPSWIGPASGSSVYSEWTFLPATAALFPVSTKNLHCPKKHCFLVQGTVLAPQL